MNKKELEEFQKQLMEMKRNILNSLQGSKKEVQESNKESGYVQHQADRGTDDYNESINLEVSSQEYQILKQIDRALVKIQENTYGICDITGKKIPIKRLEAIPYATMTVEAQQMLEKGKL